jgi:uncharacterized protein YaiI (UPF0178 family)
MQVRFTDSSMVRKCRDATVYLYRLVSPKVVRERFCLLHIFIDADACPVKHEVYRVASRYHLDVTLVANSWMRVPDDQRVSLKVVEAGPDEADNWIVKNVQLNDIVVTADIPLASRCLKKGASVIGTTGKPFTENNIGDSVATRDLLSELRDAGEITGGPQPMKKSDRSRFLQRLDEVVQAIRRKHLDMAT